MATPSLAQRITNTYRLMLSARANGEKAAEATYTRRMNDLLERIPRPARF
ncbi:hypothetical protein [Rhodococcoides fascians]|nr:hypothetical protein [Rhodococcus fascians]